MAAGFKTGGRKRGSRNKTAFMQDRRRARRGGILPLEYMLKVMRDESAELQIRNDMAKAAAPYLHAKVAEDKPAVNIDNSRTVNAELTGIAVQFVTPSLDHARDEAGPPNAPHKLLEDRINAAERHLMPEYAMPAENTSSTNGHSGTNGGGEIVKNGAILRERGPKRQW